MNRFSLRGAALAGALIVSMAAGPALADNYNVRDGNGLALVLAGKLVSSILYPFHIMMGQIGGTGAPQAVNVDSSGNVSVNCASGCAASGSATGSAVPATAGYPGLNVGGTLRGQTGSNPSGSIYSSQHDIVAVGGASVSLGQKAMASGFPVVIASDQSVLAVGGSEATVSTTPTIQAAAYASGNCMGGFNAVTLARVSGGTGIITNLRISFVGGATQSLTVYLFDASPSASTCTDKSTFTLNSADIDKLITAPFVLTPAAPTGTTVSTAERANINLPYIAGGSTGSGVRTVYFALVAGGAVTPASTSDAHVKIAAAND